MSTKILFPTDYSTGSNAALRYALQLARQSGASLLVLHVKAPRIFAAASNQEDRNDVEQAELLTLLSTVSDGETPVPHEFVVVGGDPAEEIVRAAREQAVDLVVMAATGRSGLRRVLMGSVAAAVLREAPCPVLHFRQPLDGGPAPVVGVPEWPGPEASLEKPATTGPEARTAAGNARETSATLLLKRAVEARATDIHIDPYDDSAEVRFRIDGRLERYCRLDPEVARGLISQFKVMAGVDIADPFHPSEGHISLSERDANCEVRLSRVPVSGGESLALRLLDRRRVEHPLDRLGLTAEALEQLHDILRLGEGLVLVTGPTGAGKTTTAYSMIRAIDNGHRNIVTIEDPIEYRVPGFRQMAVDPRHGVTMTTGLRALLRMDPDIVLVGEIRDCETAEIAMRAASSGKYVFSTLHTRDVASTITALRDLHIDNRSLAANLTGIISQRLVRRLCPHCRGQVSADERQIRLFADNDLASPDKLPAMGRCPRCRETGYFERTGVFEVAVSSRELRDAIERDVPEDELRSLLRSAGARSLLADGLQKVRDEITTLDEIRAMSWVTLPSGT